MSNEITPFAAIRRASPAGNEFWSSRDFARELEYTDYRIFEALIATARTQLEWLLRQLHERP